MASTIGMVGKAMQPDEAVLNVMKRSRLSIHFNTHRVRRWLLVQLVSIPVQPAHEHEHEHEQEQETATAHTVQFSSSQTTLERLVDTYSAAQFTRRWA